jgi:hypothetical protein
LVSQVLQGQQPAGKYTLWYEDVMEDCDESGVDWTREPSPADRALPAASQEVRARQIKLMGTPMDKPCANVLQPAGRYGALAECALAARELSANNWYEEKVCSEKRPVGGGD